MRAVSALVFLCCAVVGQERRPAFGAVTEGGEPVAGARVVCAGSPWLGEVEGPTDVVEAVTDTRGRFVVRLLGDRGYAVFATVARDAGTACSALAELTCGGVAGLALRAPLPPTRLRTSGEEAWAELSPLRFEVAPIASRAPWVALDGERTLPAMPGPSFVRVLDRGGRELWTGVLREDETKLALPPIHTLAVRVRDDAGPVAGAELWQECARSYAGREWIVDSQRPEFRRAGITGADGLAELRMPVPVQDGKVQSIVTVQVRAPGRSVVYAGVQQQGPPYVGAASLAVPADQVLPVSVEPDLALAVEPPAVCSVLFVAEQMKMIQRCETHVRATCDDRGQGRVPLQLGPGTLRALARVDVAGEPPVWSVAVCDGTTVRVARTSRRIDVQVTGQGGGPPTGARCVVVPERRGMTLPDVPIALDAAGRGSIHVGPGRWIVLAATADHVAHEHLEEKDGDKAVSLPLAAPPSAILQFVDAEGRPVSGAKGTSISRSATGPRASWCDTILGHRAFAHWPERLATADADGRIHLPLPLHGTRCRVMIAGRSHDLEPGAVIEIVE